MSKIASLPQVRSANCQLPMSWYFDPQKAAYLETALEDQQICRRLDRGRRALWQQGLDDAGPYQSPMEDAIVHFHEWLRRGLATETRP